MKTVSTLMAGLTFGWGLYIATPSTVEAKELPETMYFNCTNIPGWGAVTYWTLFGVTVGTTYYQGGSCGAAY